MISLVRAVAGDASDISTVTANAHTRGAARYPAVTLQRLHGPDEREPFAFAPRLAGAGLPHAAADSVVLAAELCRCCCPCHCFGSIHAALSLKRTLYLSVCR